MSMLMLQIYLHTKSCNKITMAVPWVSSLIGFWAYCEEVKTLQMDGGKSFYDRDAK